MMADVKKLVVDHPLAAQLLTRLRDERTDRATFRNSMDVLATILVYEASRGLASTEVEVVTPLQTTKGIEIHPKPLVVPVLRAGLGLLSGVLRLMPETPTGFVGLARNEETHEPESYMNSVPEQLEGREVMVLDPMLATGGSLLATCELLHERGAGRVIAVTVLCSPEGVDRIDKSGLVDELVTASIDEGLNERAFILPGLGDAGDRLFGTA